MYNGINGYFLFDSIGHVLRCEKLCKKNRIAYQLRPVPRNLSSECGICLLTEKTMTDQVKRIIEKNQLKYRDVCFQ